MTTVDDPTLLRTMFYLWERLKLVVEPTGALGAAAALEGTTPFAGERVGVILSGGNVDLAQVGGWIGDSDEPQRWSPIAVFGSSACVVSRFGQPRRRRTHCRAAGSATRGRGAGHVPANQRRLHDRADRRPRRAGARRDAEAEARQGAGRTPLLVLAGDFLSPSVASSVFKGEQMIAALNAAGLDLATLGNHEFDFGDDVLIQRMREANLQWVVSNVVDTAHRPADRRRRALPGQDIRHAEGRLHRPVPQHAGDHRRQAEAHAHRRSARPPPASTCRC